MKITVITVVFNRANVIANCIASVKMQTYKNYEHIIIDGLSTDGTVDVVNKSIDSHIRFVSEKDNGIFDAVNKGLSMATGDIVAILNSDDYYCSSNVFDSIIAEFSVSEYDLVFGNVQFVRQPHCKPIRKYNSMIFNSKLIEYGFMPAHPATFMAKRIIDTTGLYSTDYKIAGDFDYFARIFKLGDIKFKAIDAVIAEMVVGGASTSGIKSKILLNRETIKSLRKNGYKTSWFKMAIKYIIKLKEII